MSEKILKEHQKLATQVTLVGALLDLVLGLLKISIGLLSNSFALVADGIHSLSDLVTDAFVLVITRISKEKPDAEHPYGHGRFETIGTIIIGIILFSVAGVICYDSIRRLGTLEALSPPGLLALLVAGLSIVSKEWIYRYTKATATQINSSLLLANAWHSRTDALSSIAVFIGIVGTIAGYPWMDIVAAVFVALMIARIAWSLVASSLKELVDTALPEKELEAIRLHIINSKGIVDSHELRSRLYGNQVFLDIHVQVASTISVSEGHYLAESLSQSLRKTFSNISDVVVHIDPELDTDENGPLLLPLRDEILEILLARWEGIIAEENLGKLNLHYLDEQIQIELFVDNSLVNNELIDNLNNSLKGIAWLSSLKVYGTF